jgi:hypothetical protein
MDRYAPNSKKGTNFFVKAGGFLVNENEKRNMH